MKYTYRAPEGTLFDVEYPMGEAPEQHLGCQRVYAVPEFSFDGGRDSFHNSTLEADRRHQRNCLLDAGVPPEAIQPVWQKDYSGP